MAEQEESDALLDVARPELLKALRTLSRTSRCGEGEEAVLSYDGACLHVALAGVTVTMPAEGVWPGQARVSGDWILLLHKVPPASDPVRLSVCGGYFFAGTTSIRCAWQSAWSALVDLPVNASILHYLALRQKYTNEQIMQSGLSANVKSAEITRDRAIAQAMKSLAKLGVSEADLRGLIDEKARNLPGV